MFHSFQYAAVFNVPEFLMYCFYKRFSSFNEFVFSNFSDFAMYWEKYYFKSKKNNYKI